MFTIHHQRQLAVWLKEQKNPHKLRAIMERERNEEFMRLAEEKGYLQSPSKEYILKKGRTKSGRKAGKLPHIRLLKMSGMKLMDMGEVSVCSRLKVCIMPGNYLSRFDSLANCPELVNLDLHSNQISTLPGPDFWRMLTKLKVVYLHNNSIGRLVCLQNMSTAADLQVLTMYDTPISLKRSYRHHVVNSIWSLKALDNHVISDEEIIEDAIFGGHFGTMHPALRYNPVPHSKKDSTLEEELSLIQQVLQSVTAIQAKHSPVIIIQRYVRGHQARKHYRKYRDARIWASICIQHYWRRYKNIKYTTQKASQSRTSSSTSFHKAPKGLTPPATVQTLLPSTDATHLKPDIPVLQRHHLDYDTYLKNRRPGSKSPSLVSSMPAKKGGNKLVGALDGQREFELSVIQPTSPGPVAPASPVRKRTNLRIDLTRLETEPLNVQCPDPAQAVVIETTFGVQESIESIMSMKPGEKAPEPAQVKRLREKRETHEKRKKRLAFKTVKQMLGQLPEEVLDRQQEDSEGEDEPETKFRIAGFKSVFHKDDPLQELVMLKREVGKDLRYLHHEIIDKAMRAPKPKSVKHKKPNADQRMFSRVQGTMGMACLRAVQQAYRDREKAEKHTSKSDYVASLRDRREEGRRRAHSILQDKRNHAVKQKDIDLNNLADCLDKQVLQEQADLDKRKERRFKSSDITNSLQQEIQFSTDFIGQQTSISNALQKHDHQSKCVEHFQGKVGVVQTNKGHRENQSDLVRHYLEHRKLMRQAQVSVERVALDTYMLQEASKRILESHSRIEKQKQKIQSVKAFYPLPKGATQPVLPPVREEGQADRWHTLIAMYEGRVGNYPTMAVAT